MNDVPFMYLVPLNIRTFIFSCSAPRMFEGVGDGTEAQEGEQQGYTDVTVREAVEWTMGKDTEFTYIDVRSAEEHEKLATVRYGRYWTMHG